MSSCISDRARYSSNLSKSSGAPGQSILMSGKDQDIEKKWRNSIDCLLRLRNIGDDWDGEGSIAPFPEIIDSAIKLIQADDLVRKTLPPPDRITPRRDGQVGLEWFIGQMYLSVRIFAPGAARCMCRAPGQKDEFFSWDWLSEDRGITWT